MKITATDLETLRQAVSPLDTPELRAAYVSRNFPQAHSVKDLDKRYHWDLLNAAGSWRLVCDLYDKGLNDVHIDTALRSIVPALEGSR